MPSAECRTGSVLRPPSPVLRRPSSAGFTLAEVLVALACALVMTTAAASALVTVLRAERGLWARRRATHQAESWLATRYAGRTETTPVHLRFVELEDKRADWQWLTGEPEAGGPPMATVWIRAPAGGPAQ